MYRSVGHAVEAMLRYQERQRAPRSAPFPDHAPKGASTYNRWRYVYVHSGGAPAEQCADEDLEAMTVVLIFHRLDRYRYLSRILIERHPLSAMPCRERGRALRTLIRFSRELCGRGLLENPPKGCPGNLQREFPSCRSRCRADERKRLTR